jgi:hypothetical protein
MPVSMYRMLKPRLKERPSPSGSRATFPWSRAVGSFPSGEFVSLEFHPFRQARSFSRARKTWDNSRH